MTKAGEFLKKVQESDYPANVFFSGGNMPEDDETGIDDVLDGDGMDTDVNDPVESRKC